MVNVATIHRKHLAESFFSIIFARWKQQVKTNMLTRKDDTKIRLCSLPYFRTCFKEEFGMSPTEYLKTI